MREDSQLLIGLHRIVKDLDRETTGIAAKYGLTFPQFMVLEALLHKSTMSVGEIREAILSSNGTIPVIINNLVKLGLVMRIRDPNDGRRSLVELTNEGRELIADVCPENDAMYQGRFDVWSKEEKREMIQLLSRYLKSNTLRKGEDNAETR